MSKINSLIVEDDDDIASFVQNYLDNYEGINLETHTARSGIEALSLFKKYQHSILFVDINIPTIGGLDLIEIIKKEAVNPNIFFIVITGYISQFNLARIDQIKDIHLITKPFSDHELENALTSVCIS